MISKDFSFSDLIDKLSSGEPFAFARYGDGEWNAIFRKDGTNCDGHEYYKDMGERLAKIVRSKPPYLMGMQSLAIKTQGKQIRSFLDAYDVNIEWNDSDIMHQASLRGELPTLFETLKRRKTVIVGPVHLTKMDDYIKYKKLIGVPAKNAWLVYNNLKARLTADIMSSNNTVYLLCAGMMSEVLIDDLYHLDQNRNTFIDIGSLFDPYCGVNSRTYHQKLRING